MTKKWNMIVDVERCHSCFNCFVAAKDEYVDNEFPGYSAPAPLHGEGWVRVETSERGQWPMVQASFRPVMCNHCDDAPCIKAAKDGAIKKREDGIVIIDPEKSRGQKQLVEACPYGAIAWNDELDIPQAWPFDAHLLDNGWEKTKLETVCPTGVFESVKLTDNEMQSRADADGLETLEPQDGARPRVWYKNSYLFESCFVGGTCIYSSADGVQDVVEGVRITALRDGEAAGSAESDGFGEFCIDGLEPGGEVVLQIARDGFQALELTVELGESRSLGCIELSPA